MCGWQNPKDPQFEPMADDAITRGRVWNLPYISVTESQLFGPYGHVFEFTMALYQSFPVLTQVTLEALPRGITHINEINCYST